MAISKWTAKDSFKAGRNLSTLQYRIVKGVTGTRDYVTFSNASGDVSVGVLYNKPTTSGEAAEVVTMGTPKVKLGDQVTVGSFIAPNASGLGVSAATTGANPIGAALWAGSTGDLVPVQLGRTKIKSV